MTKEQELRAANIPFDETEDALRELFFQFLHRWQQGEPIEQPGLPEGEPTADRPTALIAYPAGTRRNGGPSGSRRRTAAPGGTGEAPSRSVRRNGYCSAGGGAGSR